jgi:hypothetical protein
VPHAGYGMNAGIADAADLAWLLGAYRGGWASIAILDAYERERLPITDQVSRFAMDHAERMIRSRSGVPAGIEDEGPQGDAVRASFGREMVDLNVAQYCCAGLNFGSFHGNSPLIAYDGEPQPPYTMGTFTPSTVPGCRLPHVWLGNGRSLYDSLGAGYTLVREAAARRRRLPLEVLDLSTEDPPLPGARHRLILVRPDHHVAWRGDTAPVGAEAEALVDLVRGAR